MDRFAAQVALLLLIGVTETLLVHVAFRCLMHRNERGRLEYALSLALYLVCTMFDAASSFPVYFVLLICYALITFIAFRFYEGSREERLIIPFVFVAVNYAATIYASVIAHATDVGVVGALPDHLAQTAESQVLLSGLVVAFVGLLRICRRVERAGGAPAAALAFGVPLLTLLLLVHEFYMVPVSSRPENLFWQYAAIATLLLLTAITLYSLCSRIGELVRSLDYSATLEQMLGMQERYYRALQEHQERVRRLQHDMKNHCRAMAGMLERGDAGGALSYVRELTEGVEAAPEVIDCDNQLLGALLNDRLGPCEAHGVAVSACVMMPARCGVSSIDLCILVGNLLDNAIEACERMRGGDARRFIDADIRQRGPFLCVTVSNSYAGAVRLKGTRYLTTKGDDVHHGIGLTNVQMVVDKYDGRLKIDHESGVFTVTALLACPDEDPAA